MQVEVIVPELGLPEGQDLLLSAWFAEQGDDVYEEDRLVELLLEGATFDVAAPASGQLAEILAFPDDILQAGQVLGIIEVPDPDAVDAPQSEANPPA